MFPQPLMNHTIIQMAYVVRDIRETAKDWQETFGIGPFFLLEDINITDPHYRGKPQEVDFSVAVCQTGDIHVEFIQQNCDSPSCYRDMFAAGEEGFHHVGIIAEDYEKEVARYTDMGFEIAFNGTMGPMDFCYVDTSSKMGCMVEVLENQPFINNYFSNLRNAAENWDGSNPIRSAAELF